jgi:hypothetical protein
MIHSGHVTVSQPIRSALTTISATLLFPCGGVISELTVVLSLDIATA